MMKSQADSQRPPFDWHLVTSSPEGWQRFCGLTGLKVIALATRRVRTRGESIAEATNLAIEEIAEDLCQHDPPPGVVEAFLRDYRADRANQMAMVADSLRDAEAPPPRRKRKRLSS